MRCSVWWWWWWCVCGARAAGPHCAPRAACALQHAGGTLNEYIFQVEGEKVFVEFQDSKYVSVVCYGNQSLESASFPRFERAVRVPLVQVQRCAVPRASYAAALLALNVSLLEGSSLHVTEAPAALCAAHLAGSSLRALTLRNTTAPCDTLLRNQTHLRSLRVVDTPLSADLLAHLPAELETLSLQNANVSHLTVAHSRLRMLTVLSRSGRVSLKVERAPALKQLTLESGSVPALAALPVLETLHVSRWEAVYPTAWLPCDHLGSLTLVSPAARELPARWVAHCPLLKRLTVQYARNLTSLQTELLANASALTHLTVSMGALETLQVGVLDGAPDLIFLDLSGNRLVELPSGMFAASRALRSLDLSGNRLSAEVLAAVSALATLTALKLARNTALGDACSGGTHNVYAFNGASKIENLCNLTLLDLSHTRVSRICADWRERMPRLARLDLSHTAVARLSYYDTQMTRAVGSVVLLEGAPVAALEYDRTAYHRAATAPPTNVTFQLERRAPALHCDCALYWAAAALRRYPHHARFTGLRCADGGALEPTALTCSRADLCASVPPCQCAWREDAAGGTVLRVTCEAAGLRAVPRSPLLNATMIDMALAGNRISQLSIYDLPRNLRTLDLRNNSIRDVEAETADALAGLEEVRLEGNRLSCDCGAVVPLAGARWARGLRCADGRLVVAALEPCTAPATPLLTLLCAGALLAAVLGALVARLAHRRLKPALRRLWWVAGAGAGAEDTGAEPYDVFVCFEGEQDAPVALAVTRGLEARAHRVLAQERDWVAGCGVEEGVRAGVAAARATVAVASRRWVRGWAGRRAACESALRRARLVLVLVEADALAEAEELRQYAAKHPWCAVQWAGGGRRAFTLMGRAVPPPRVPPNGAPAA